jgi:hypothetical protein
LTPSWTASAYQLQRQGPAYRASSKRTVTRKLVRQAPRTSGAPHPFFVRAKLNGRLGFGNRKKGGKNHILILLTNKAISQGEFLHVLEDNQVIRI